MARSNIYSTFTCLLGVLLLLSHLESSYALTYPRHEPGSEKNCSIHKHPDVSDLLGTNYLSHVNTARLLSSNRTYRYVHYAPDRFANKSTILFLHGFPSSSFDWREQFHFFASRGYGILAPDLLGFGGTDKPSNPDAYTLKKQATEVVALLDCVTGGGKTVVVGHDLGSPVLSRIANYYPSRFEKYAFLDIGYQAPGKFLTKEVVQANQNVLGYQIYFNTDGTGAVLDQHQDSIFTISYNNDNSKYWPTYFSPTGRLEAFVKANETVPVISVVTGKDEAIHNAIFAPSRGGYEPTLNHYRAPYRDLNTADDNALPPSAAILTHPVLLLTASDDTIGTPATAENSTRPYAPDLEVQQIESGHFLMLEKAEEVNEAMRVFFEK